MDARIALVLLGAALLGPIGTGSAQPGAPADAVEAAVPATLGVGDKAPELQIGEWVKGEPVEAFEPGKVFVVEFWATWCGPCIAGMPHLSEVQKRFKDKGVTVIGVNVWDDPANVAPFLADQGGDEKMQYTVAIEKKIAGSEAEGGEMTARWMDPAGQSGIPCAFIIDKQGRVAWIGHPAMEEFEATIDAIVRDEFDIEAAGKARAEAEAAAGRVGAMQAELHEAWAAGDHELAFGLADEIIASDPASMQRWAWWKFESLMVGVGDTARAYAFVREVMTGPYREDADMLMRFAYGIADSLGIEDPDLDLALDLAERAVAATLGQDSQKLAGLAMVRHSRREFAEAVAVLERAIAVAPTPETKEYLENELEFYKWDLEDAERGED